jgi:hypothetical protein
MRSYFYHYSVHQSSYYQSGQALRSKLRLLTLKDHFALKDPYAPFSLLIVAPNTTDIHAVNALPQRTAIAQALYYAIQHKYNFYLNPLDQGDDRILERAEDAVELRLRSLIHVFQDLSEQQEGHAVLVLDPDGLIMDDRRPLDDLVGNLSNDTSHLPLFWFHQLDRRVFSSSYVARAESDTLEIIQGALHLLDSHRQKPTSLSHQFKSDGSALWHAVTDDKTFAEASWLGTRVHGWQRGDFMVNLHLTDDVSRRCAQDYLEIKAMNDVLHLDTLS